jgi:hypothetical protein
MNDTYTLAEIEAAFKKLDTVDDYGVSWDEFLREIAPEEYERRQAEARAKHEEFMRSWDGSIEVAVDFSVKADSLPNMVEGDSWATEYLGQKVRLGDVKITPAEPGYVRVSGKFLAKNDIVHPDYLLP